MILSADNWGPVAKNLRFLCPLLVRWLQKTNTENESSFSKIYDMCPYFKRGHFCGKYNSNFGRFIVFTLVSRICDAVQQISFRVLGWVTCYCGSD